MNRPGPDAAVPCRRLRRLVGAVLAATWCAAGCTSPTAPASSSSATTTTTVATTARATSAVSGPAVQPSFETGVPDAVVSFTGGPPAATTAAVAPSGATPADEVRRGEGGDLLVVTWGSTTCPRMPVNVTALDPATLDIVTGNVRIDPVSNDLAVPETSVCVNDLGPTTSAVRLPEGAAGTGPLTVIVDGVRHTVA
ncbi:hypothetical protein [Nakamurella deserti]|uniref:hypothetical protein n=1 Tax=Nakamurella deserti TaxID=2164074 RepID=UPI000DBE8CC4|nr:hypothetical protein [Nakamurella deserti]